MCCQKYSGESKFSSIFVMWDTICQFWMLFAKVVKRLWSTLDCYMLSSSNNFLAGFASLSWTTALKSMVLGQPNLAELLKFLQPKQNFLNHFGTALWSAVLVFGYLCIVMAQFEFVVHLCDFQITPGVKQCTICQCINYHGTIHHSGYFLSWLELLWSLNIGTAN